MGLKGWGPRLPATQLHSFVFLLSLSYSLAGHMMCENRKTASDWLCLLLIRIYFLCYRAEERKTALVPFPGKQELVTIVDLFWGSCGVGNVERSLCTSINPIGQGRQDRGAVAGKRDKRLGHKKNGEALPWGQSDWPFRGDDKVSGRG